MVGRSVGEILGEWMSRRIGSAWAGAWKVVAASTGMLHDRAYGRAPYLCSAAEDELETLSKRGGLKLPVLQRRSTRQGAAT